MARRTAKANPTNASEAMELIASTEPLKTVEEAAKLVGVAEIRVLEMFSETLNLPEAMVQDYETVLSLLESQFLGALLSGDWFEFDQFIKDFRCP